MITYASTGRPSQLRYTEDKWTMNVPADDGGLLKPDVVEGAYSLVVALRWRIKNASNLRFSY
ncbi:hypothetical protein Syun_001373 [Stephania yunnanensis]|uniref:Uncharacterized protein n=1 Tax=Stephania yunnanensis TaxID=152371 RepID=A0AAP0JJR9_9MAGN